MADCDNRGKIHTTCGNHIVVMVHYIAYCALFRHRLMRDIAGITVTFDVIGYKTVLVRVQYKLPRHKTNQQYPRT